MHSSTADSNEAGDAKTGARPIAFVITSVDYAPDDLEDQTPIRGRLLRRIAGPDPQEYWLAELKRPLSWTVRGATQTIRHLILKPRWQGTAIGPGARIPVNIYYVTGTCLSDAPSFAPAHVAYVAIGMIKVSWVAALFRAQCRKWFGIGAFGNSPASN